MKITWYGQSCFKLQNNRDVLLINPHSPKSVGLKGPGSKATIFVLTDPKDKEGSGSKEGFLINNPGEYEVRGIMIYGIDCARKDKGLTIYQIEMDGIRFGILGEIDTSLKSEELEHLDGIDVLFIPVGGKNTIGTDKAIEIINSIEPKIVIPCCYKIPKTRINMGTLEEFLKEMGVKNIEKIEKFSLNKKDLPSEETKVVVLEPRI